MGDPIDDYLNQITGEVDPGTAPGADTVANSAGPGVSSSSTLQEVLAANGRVTSIVPLPQSEQDSLAAIMGGKTKEPVNRYWFENGRYVDVGTQTSSVYRGTALSSLKPQAQAKPTLTPPGSLDQTDPFYVVWDPEAGDYVKKPNPLFDPDAAATRKSLLAAQLANAQRLAAGGGGADNSLGYATLGWSRERAAQTDAITAARNAQLDAMKRETEAAAYKQFVEEQARTDARNRLTNTTQFTNNLLDTWANATPSAMIPGQQQFLGFEPGGPMEQLVRMGGGRYDPNLYRPAPVQLDPNAAWKQAQGLIGGSR